VDLLGKVCANLLVESSLHQLDFLSMHFRITSLAVSVAAIDVVGASAAPPKTRAPTALDEGPPNISVPQSPVNYNPKYGSQFAI
jgi:hypothetical protein